MASEPWKGSPWFWATCPKCGERQRWMDAKTCQECGARLYPSAAEIESVQRRHEYDRYTKGRRGRVEEDEHGVLHVTEPAHD